MKSHKTAFPDAFSEYDLLGAIKIPPDDGVEFVEGSDGFPAFSIRPDADVKSPYRMVLPEKFFEFAVMAAIRPETRTGGYLFSVVNPLDTIVQLGIHISPAIKDKWNVSLLYTDASVHMTSQKIATFEIPYSHKWTQIAMRVLRNKVTLYYNCNETETVIVKREPQELVFDSASTLYLAQAGPLLKGNFEVSTLILSKFFNFCCWLAEYIRQSNKSNNSNMNNIWCSDHLVLLL